MRRRTMCGVGRRRRLTVPPPPSSVALPSSLLPPPPRSLLPPPSCHRVPSSLLLVMLCSIRCRQASPTRAIPLAQAISIARDPLLHRAVAPPPPSLVTLPDPSSLLRHTPSSVAAALLTCPPLWICLLRAPAPLLSPSGSRRREGKGMAAPRRCLQALAIGSSGLRAHVLAGQARRPPPPPREGRRPLLPACGSWSSSPLETSPAMEGPKDQTMGGTQLQVDIDAKFK